MAVHQEWVEWTINEIESGRLKIESERPSIMTIKKALDFSGAFLMYDLSSLFFCN